jgi:hypothetical protein
MLPFGSCTKLEPHELLIQGSFWETVQGSVLFVHESVLLFQESVLLAQGSVLLAQGSVLLAQGSVLSVWLFKPH